MSERIDFSANAGIYDRRHGASVSDDGLQRLWLAARVHKGARVLDIGAGTGRVAIPLAVHGCRVAAVEPASGMLAQLRAKDGEGRVQVIIAEGARLPFPTGLFDVAVVARLLYLTTDWRTILSEVRRVLAVGGVLLHEWGNGQADEEWVRIREEARRLFEQAGVSSPFHPGVRSETEVDAQLVALQMVREGQVDMGPGPTITLREFLRRLTDGELSYIWNVPEQVRTHSLPSLRRWSEQTFDLEAPIPMPRHVHWTIYRKDAG
jgi:SAM-dependent methyltransferase